MRRHTTKAAARLLLTGMVLGMPSAALAQIYNCNGEWTNKPCAGQPRAVLQEERSTEDPKERSLREKRSALHELNMRTITARDHYDIRYDTGAVEDYCYDPSTTLDNCRERVQSALDKLDEKITAIAAVKTEQERNKQREEANRIASERQNTTAVQITENVYVLPRPRPRPPICPGGYVTHDFRCVPSGHHGHHGHHGSFGIGVQGSGHHGSIGIGAGGTVTSVPRSSPPVIGSRPRFKGYKDPGRPR